MEKTRTKVMKEEGMWVDNIIEGVKYKRLKVYPDERGSLIEIFRNDDEDFLGGKFGQLITSICYPGVVKGWHIHSVQVDRLAVISGMAKIVLYDARENSPTKGEINEFFVGERNPLFILIPPGVYHGLKAIGTQPSITLGLPTELYKYDEPDEFRVHPHNDEIPYNWDRQDG
ncbi:dTDP-4-dehydrorhamnose 3,5-epimerase family protein [Clostridium ljungdahlii]|uniref:dTDP-4-dehydrorhamnose 3,5-epimerase n=1 Tax=Clostridium ljungdahlii (strain ATCC 55383 / DSM 13528 / PETC) TaxID=748727 RepID=D8GTZ7_CLOLD|nr:dTDP-4-dehydrorhamnose 3,5-epimerase family protein [Clostridium ljungdahlii]ADK16810.1 dTDP-4-dehydrorhamnose 3,5 epimerase [Clostridium ljungdahlii DSM 13528]OAA85649.1 dTDP-4-dehydrorhamnose 3,5-epimerase [Clostridium ljungdahlii DSM 13528]